MSTEAGAIQGLRDQIVKKERQTGSDITNAIAQDSTGQSTQSTQATSLPYLLERQGYSVVVCENGIQALAAAKRHKPMLVISGSGVQITG